MTEEIVFEAYFPPTQGAIQRHGAGDGMRIVLDIPESSVPNAVNLLAWVQDNLVVTIRRQQVAHTFSENFT